MANEHVFPVCSPSFNVLDFDTTDESQSYPHSTNSEQYAGVSSTGVEFTVVVRIADGQVSSSQFALQEGGEYLVNDDISAPSETTLDWTGDSNGIQINLYSLDSVINETSSVFTTFVDAINFKKRLNAGEVICIGSKPVDSAFSRNVLPSVYARKEDGTTFVSPFSSDEFGLFNSAFTLNSFVVTASTSFNSAASQWMTFMWSGTRWVFLGSNNWL